MTPEELDALAFKAETPTELRSFPPPTTPTPPPPSSPFSQMRELLTTMQEIDRMKLSFMEQEMKKQEMIEQRVESRLLEKLKAEAAPGSNALEQEAIGFIFDLAKRAFSGQTAPPPLPSSLQQKISPTIAPESVMAAPESPLQEVVMIPHKVTEEFINSIADQIDDNYPQECKEAREGKVSKEEAIKRLKTGGIPENIVERVYESILNIDDKNDSHHEVEALGQEKDASPDISPREQ